MGASRSLEARHGGEDHDSRGLHPTSQHNIAWTEAQVGQLPTEHHGLLAASARPSPGDLIVGVARQLQEEDQ